jgi:hypothetical protein
MTRDERDAIPRALQLAKSGRYAGVTEIIWRLREEGYPTGSVMDRTFHEQLRELFVANRISE